MSMNADKARIADIDALRSFALYGILVVNIMTFASAYYGAGVSDPVHAGTVDRAVGFIVALFFETKFYLLFSFLFGYSFTLQMQSAQHAGEAFVPRLLRRQAGLWVAGLAHAVLLYRGDILTTYAVLGLLLLWLRDIGEGRSLRTAFWQVLIVSSLWAGLGAVLLISGEPIDTSSAIADAERALQAYRGTPATVIEQNLRELRIIWIVTGLMQAPCALAMFLLGLVAGKRQMFVRFDDYRPLFRRIAMAGLLVGLPGGIFYAWTTIPLAGSGWEVVGLGIGLATAPLLTGAYIALVMAGFQTRPGRMVSAALAPAGRMALSNYLLQSLVCAVIFYGYGMRLMGELPPLAVQGIAAAIFAAQLVASRWWLRRFAYGPLEWLLRAVTIAAWPRWRRRSHAEA